MSVQIFKSSLKEKLKNFGMPQDFLDLHPHYLYPGIAKCADAYTKDNIEETAREIVQNFKNNDYNKVTGIDFSTLLGETKGLLESTQAFQNLFKKLLIDLKKSDQKVRAKTINTLDVLKPINTQIQLALAEGLKDEDISVRQSAAAVLGKIKPADPKIHLLVAEALKDPDSNVRYSAAHLLREIEPTDPKIHLLLAEALKDPSVGVRNEAAFSFLRSKTADPNIHLALVELLKDYPGVQYSAWLTLLALTPTDPQVHRALVEILKSSDPTAREKAAEVLQSISRSLSLSEDKRDQFSRCLRNATNAPISGKKVDEILELLKLPTLIN